MQKNLGKYLAVVAFATILSGCETTKPVVVTRVEIQEVRVPVPVDCQATIPEEPTWNFPLKDSAATVFDKVKALLADRVLSKEYQSSLTKTLKTCRGEDRVQ